MLAIHKAFLPGAVFFFLITLYLGEPRYIGFLAGQRPWVIGITLVTSLVWGRWLDKLGKRNLRIAASFGALIGTWFSPGAAAVVDLGFLYATPTGKAYKTVSPLETLLADILGLLAAIIFAFLISWIFRKVAERLWSPK